MEQSEFLRKVVTVLDGLRIPYFVTGSTASIAYGEPRFTNDIDMVVDLTRETVEAFCSSFPPPEFYVSIVAAREAVSRRHQFNIIHPASGLKIDVIIPKGTDFDRERFRRVRRLSPSADYVASFASPEDVIIKKMEYFREGESEKHLRDIAGILAISGAQLDLAYIARWAGLRGVSEIWSRVREAAGPGLGSA